MKINNIFKTVENILKIIEKFLLLIKQYFKECIIFCFFLLSCVSYSIYNSKSADTVQFLENKRLFNNYVFDNIPSYAMFSSFLISQETNKDFLISLNSVNDKDVFPLSLNNPPDGRNTNLFNYKIALHVGCLNYLKQIENNYIKVQDFQQQCPVVFAQLQHTRDNMFNDKITDINLYLHEFNKNNEYAFFVWYSKDNKKITNTKYGMPLITSIKYALENKPLQAEIKKKYLHTNSKIKNILKDLK